MASHRAARPVQLLLVCIHVGLSACGGAAEQSGPPRATEEDLSNADSDDPAPLPAGATEATWQELGLASVSNGPAVAATPLGYLALSQRSVGDAKAPSAWESYLYRSTDGVRWQQVAVSSDNDNLWLRGVAYGNGHYVLAGMRFAGGDGVIFHSTDGERWDEIPVATGAPSGLADAVFTGGRFFALSTHRTLVTSLDGTTWTTVDLGTRTVAPRDVTFGDGRFLLVGSGEVQYSTDGLSWTPTALDCAMPGACITDPSGNVLQGSHARAVFSEGMFFIDQASSSDGQTWRSLPGQYPQDGLGGQVIGSTATDLLAIWSATQAPRALTSRRYVDVVAAGDRAARMRWNGSVRPNELSQNFPIDAPAPDQLEFPLPTGADCTTSACVLVDHRLYLLQSQQ